VTKLSWSTYGMDSWRVKDVVRMVYSIA